MEKISDFRGLLRDDLEARTVYSEAAGIGQVIPRSVAVPVDADDVVTLVRWAASRGVPLIPRGSGSSMAGGAIGDGVIVDLSRLRSIGDVDVIGRTISCGAGVLRNEIDSEARAHGLRFPVDPSSGAFCTIGGMASTNAAGARTMLYGATRAWVEALDCVFSDGSRATVHRGQELPDLPILRQTAPVLRELRREEQVQFSKRPGIRKQSSGYALSRFALSEDLVDLLVGSEGSLVIVVGVTLRLIPIQPHSASILGAFATFDDAIAATEIARDAMASCCELLDRTFLDVARRGGVAVPAPESAEAVLLMELEGELDIEVELKAELLAKEIKKVGAIDVVVALDPATEEAMWELRHAASPALARLDPALKSMQFIEDGCVPPEKLGEYVIGVRTALERQRIRGVIFGHAGDAHVHVNPLIDVREPDWRSRAEALLQEVTDLVARLGGTLSGEHGDGRLRTPLLRRVWPAFALERFAAVKRAFDPNGILNPGVKVPSSDAKAIERVKYDPALPALPATARAALARVERERAYASFRLDLLEDAELDAAKRTKSP
jgi:FAD/FMN-containing dehydrogenase